jgi:DNA-binding CsgD family transcriptional regulator
MTTHPLPTRGHPLTNREIQVLDGISRGLSNAEVGQELFLAPNTVKSHLYRVYLKLGATGRAHAVGIGYRHGLLGRHPARTVPGEQW